MEDLRLEGSNSRPAIEFKASGEITFEGRALIENAYSFFQPLFSWAEKFSAEKLSIIINLEYFNTSFSKQLLDLLKMFEENQDNKVIDIKWMYEEGDDEMLETGEIFQDLISRANFTFEEYAEIVD